MKYAACLFLLFVAVACSPGSLPVPPIPSIPAIPIPFLTPQATAAPTSSTLRAETPTPVPPKVKLLAYDYKSKDVGDGWTEGLVRLAFENIFDGYIKGEQIDLSQAVVQTQEDKTYPVTLNQVQPYEPESARDLVDFSRLTQNIPPHFRWTRLGTSADIVKYNSKAGPVDLGVGEYYLRFRVATVAHPTSIVFAKHPEWKIDLASAAQATIALPADAAYLNTKPLSALAGRVLIDNPKGLKVTLDGTGAYAAAAGDFQLKYTLVNNDKLDAHSVTVELPIRVLFFGDGAVELIGSEMTNRSLEAGPGQTKQALWSLGSLFFDKKCNSKVYALIQDAAQYEIYNLSVCK